MKILLLNENDDSKLMPYAKRYQLFDDWSKAVKEAKKIGWEDPFGMGINKEIGVANLYQCGSVKVILIALEEQSGE